MDIQHVEESDKDAITELIQAVANTHVLPHFSEQGKQEFNQRVIPDIITTYDKHHFVTLKATYGDELVGFAAMRDGNYVTHLFVSDAAQGRGLGRALLNHLLQHTTQPEIRLRSSVNASEFYRHYGFVATGEEAEFNGIRFVPMTLLRESQSTKLTDKQSAP